MRHSPDSRAELTVPAIWAGYAAVLTGQARVAEIEAALTDVETIGCYITLITLTVLVIRVALLREQAEAMEKQNLHQYLAIQNFKNVPSHSAGRYSPVAIVFTRQTEMAGRADGITPNATESDRARTAICIVTIAVLTILLAIGLTPGFVQLPVALTAIKNRLHFGFLFFHTFISLFRIPGI